MNLWPVLNVLAALALSPLLLGVINRTKAKFAGRRGQPVTQLYWDLCKLLRKGAVYSGTATWVFRAGPTLGLAAALGALLVTPFGGMPGLLRFEGDLILFAYLLGLMRFVTVLAALDTGSAFEGMGASREVTFSALAEPALLIGLAALAREMGSLSLSGIYGRLSASVLLTPSGTAFLLVAVSFLIVLLAENARIPVDDPNTHLELTMIHEVMVLDHSGPDFAFIQYGAAVKLWVLGALLTGIVMPFHGAEAASMAVSLGAMLALGVGVGTVESCMARLRLARVPSLLVSATVLSLLALVLSTFMHLRDAMTPTGAILP